MITQPETEHYTAEEYLEIEVASENRNEYCDREIFLTTDGTPEHNEIVSILHAALRVSLKGKPYSIFVADQRLWIPDRTLYTYPDIMVVPRPLVRQQGRNDTITNPIAIAEVLSKSTKSYDRDEKFSAYRTIPTFQEYLLIDQYTLHVEQYSKADSHKWIFIEYDNPDSCISLSSIPFEFRLTDLYEGIEFESQDLGIQLAMTNPAIALPMEKIAEFCQKWQVTEFALFGSVLRDDFRPDSDIDVMVQFHPDAHPTLFDLTYMEDELKILFQRDVDLITRKGIENSRNYLRRKAILSSAQVIYGPRSSILTI